MMRGNFKLIAGIGLLAAAAGASSAASKPPAESAPVPTVQNCEAHRFETVIAMTGADGKIKDSKVRMCGTLGQSNADWIRTLKDAVKKTAENPQLPRAVKDQIISAVNAEIDRLNMPALNLPAGTDIANLPKAAAKSAPDVPLSRDYGSLPPLPTTSTVTPPNVLGPGGIGGPVPHLTLRCALQGDEDRPTGCDTIDKDTVLVLRADEAFPRGLEMRFVRHGDSRAELDLPAMKVGQTTKLRLPVAVCSGVVRSRVEIQALGPNAPSGAMAGTIGDYDLRC
jgi:hypothetical protein